MNIVESCKKFCNDICPSGRDAKVTALYAVGGLLSGRCMGIISPRHAAVYAAASMGAYQVASNINIAIFQRIMDKVDDFCGWEARANFSSCVLPLRNIANLYLGYIAGNKALSLLGRQIALGTAIKTSVASGIAASFAGVVVNYMSSKIFSEWE